MTHHTSAAVRGLHALLQSPSGSAGLAALDGPAAHASGRCTLQFDCKTVTPSLLGGFDPRAPDQDQPIRAKDIRGKLRMWWRVLAAAGDLNEELRAWLGQLPDHAQLPDLERRIWGTVHGDNASKGLVRVLVLPAGTSQPGYRVYQSQRDPEPEFIGYRYALEFAKAPVGDRDVPCRELLQCGFSFGLKVDLADARLVAALLKVIHAWSRFGGVGSRNSRGIGAVALAASDGHSQLPSVAHWNCVDITNYGDFPTAEAAVQSGLRCLREFCQGVVGRNGRMGRSKWPEADTVRRAAGVHHPDHHPNRGLAGLTNAMPRLAFGHRTIRFHRDQVSPGGGNKPGFEPDVLTLVPAGAERLPSSLLIRPFRTPGSIQWKCSLVQLKALAAEVRALRVPIEVAGRPTLHAVVWKDGWRPGVRHGCDGIQALESRLLNPEPSQSGGIKHAQDAAQAFINFALRHDNNEA